MGEAIQGVEAGQLIAGRYRLIDEVGKGGMGAVWRATDERSPQLELDQAAGHVALKIILPKRLDGTPEQRGLTVGRFTREARALMALKSPHVVAIHDHGNDGEVIYIAMELLHGESLATRLKRAKHLPVAETVRMFNHMTSAIELAHRSGIIHRDLKPGNIFLAHQPLGLEDVTKVLDFGLVKSLGAPLATLDVQTRTGSLLGTPYYMSPEQARALPGLDHRTDLWSLGVIAFECLCGVKPFRGRALAMVFAQIASGVAPIPSEVAAVPRGFDAWFARSVQVDPQARFQSAGAMMAELREVLVDGALSTRNARKVRLDAELSARDNLAESPLHTAAVGSAREALPLVGRETESAAVDASLTTGARVLTLAGPTGVGKTRLAREAVRRWRVAHSLASVACWLDEAEGQPWCWLEFAAGLEMDGAGEPAEVDIARALRARGRAVFLIDAADGLRATLARALPTWLEAAPEVVFLITARGPLGVPGETVIEIGPLPPPTAAISNRRELMLHPSTALFFVRAARRDSRILEVKEATQLAEFVASFRGIPLLLHLVAGVVTDHSLPMLAENRARESARPFRTEVPDPEIAVELGIGWLYEQLSFAERSTLAQLSVFRDGITLDAAELVVDGDWRVLHRPYEVVLDLAARGLLQHEEPLVGENRYRMAPALARHAARMLATISQELDPQANDAPRRHATFFAALSEPEALAPLKELGGFVRRTRLTLETSNLRAALTWAVQNDEYTQAAALAMALATALRLERLPSRALVTLDEVARHPGLKLETRFSLELERGRCLRLLRRDDLAWTAFESARAHAHQLRDAARESIAIAELGLTALQTGNAHEAHRACVAAMQLAGDQGTAYAVAMNLLGELSLELGRSSDADAAFEHAALHFGLANNRILEVEVLMRWGASLAEASDNERARQLFEDAHERYGLIGDRLGQTRALAWLGELQGRSDPTTAHRTLEKAAARARELGCAAIEGENLALWALSLLEMRQSERAMRGVRRAEELLRGTNDPGHLLLLCICRAWLAVCANDHPAAMFEWNQAEPLRLRARLRGTSRLGGAARRLEAVLKG